MERTLIYFSNNITLSIATYCKYIVIKNVEEIKQTKKLNKNKNHLFFNLA